MSKMNDRKVMKKMGIVAQEVTKSKMFLIPEEFEAMRKLVESKNDVDVSCLMSHGDKNTIVMCQWIE